MKSKIKQILRKHGKNQTNLSSSTAREIIATEIMEVIENNKEVNND